MINRLLNNPNPYYIYIAIVLIFSWILFRKTKSFIQILWYGKHVQTISEIVRSDFICSHEGIFENLNSEILLWCKDNNVKILAIKKYKNGFFDWEHTIYFKSDEDRLQFQITWL